MKSIFTKLSTLLLCGAFAMTGCSDFSADLRDVNQKLEDVKADVEVVTKDVKDLKELSATKAQVQELADEIEALKKQLKDQYVTGKEVEEITTSIENVQESVEKAQANLDKVIDDKADKSEVKAAVNELETTLENAKKEITEVVTNLTTDNKELTDSVNDLVSKVATLLADVETLKKNLSDLNGEVDTLSSELKALTDKVNSLTTDLSGLQATFNEYKTEIENKFVEVNNNITKLSEDLDGKIEALKDDLKDNELAAEVIPLLADLQNRLGEVEASLENLTTLVNAAASKDELDAAVEALEADLLGEIADLQKQIANLSTPYDDTALKNLIAGKADQTDLATLQAQVTNKADLEALENALNGVATMKDIARLEEMIKGNTTALATLEKLAQDIQVTQDELSSLEEQLKNYATTDALSKLEEAVKGTATVEQLEALKKYIEDGDAAISEKFQKALEGTATLDDLKDLEDALGSYAKQDAIDKINAVIENTATKEELEALQDELANYATKEALDALDAALDGTLTQDQYNYLKQLIGEGDEDLQKKLDNVLNGTATEEEVADVRAALEELASKEALEELQNVIDGKASQEEIDALIETLSDYATAAALEDLKAVVDGKADDAQIEALQTLIEDANKAIYEAIENLQSGKASTTEVEMLKEALENYAQLSAITRLEDAIAGNTAAIEELKSLVGSSTVNQDTIDNLKEELMGEINALWAIVGTSCDCEDLSADLAALEALLNDLQNLVSGKADAADVENALATLDALSEKVAALADDFDALDTMTKDEVNEAIESAIDELEKALSAELAELTNKVNNWKDTVYDDTELKNALAAATAEYKALVADLQAQIDALEDSLNNLNDRVDNLEQGVTALRSVVLVPEVVYNGTKAVKFHRMEGENLLKTFSDVSFHFNPSNFDIESATYEIVAENVEFMTKSAATDAPAIEIVGKPVQENGKVTFRLERAEGAGNMFALKVTLADGNVIYSEYAAILDEATYCIVTALAKVDVSRIAFELPEFNTLSSIIEYVQSLGSTVEDFAAYIDYVGDAVTAIQNNDVFAAIEAITKLPGFVTKTQTIEGVGTYKVQVETLDAEEILESLKNAQTVTEITNILTEVLSKAEGLGETGDAIIGGLQSALDNSNINDLMSELETLEKINLADAEISYDKTVELLSSYKASLQTSKDELAVVEANLNDIVASLSDEDRANVESLYSQYESASELLKIAIELQIAEIAGSDYIKVRAELLIKEGYVATAEGLVNSTLTLLEKYEDELKVIENKIAELEQQILDAAKDYVMNSEVGEYITQLENALAEQGWEAKKAAAQSAATVFAMDAALAELIQNYNAANQQVVDEFANSLFGRFVFLIQTPEAAEAFENLCLTEVYVALKQIPDILTQIIKYYPTSVEDLLKVVPEVTDVTWETEYLLAE